jgi:hypothetical protein
MALFSWEYVFRPREAQWWVGIVFTLLGLGLSILLPALLAPSWSGIETPARVVRLESNAENLVRPVFQVAGEEREYGAQIWSSRSAFIVGQELALIRNADGSDWYVKADPDMQSAIWIVRLLGAVFLLIGSVVLTLTVLDLPTYLVHTIGGALGALSFGIPATFVLPGLMLAHTMRPNMFFLVDDAFGLENWLIGGLFTVLGIVTTVATIILARYQLKTQTLGWGKSFYWRK